MNLRHLIPLILVMAMAFTGCKKKELPAAMQRSVTTTGTPVADTITYDVVITNPDPQDTWTAQCLSRLNRKGLVDSLFSMVYDETAIAYNFETLEKMTPAQVKKLESAEGFSRDEIGKIQFTEAWYINSTNNTMTKEVLSVVLGSNFYDSEGNLFGHKPVMRIVLR
jgi:hypothetical protein